MAASEGGRRWENYPCGMVKKSYLFRKKWD